MNSRIFILSLCIASITGCNQASPEQAARAAGLMPEKIETLISAGKEETITNPYLKAVKDSLKDVKGIKFPDPPPRIDYSALFNTSSSSAYRGFDTDRIDASTYDTLTNSLNDILQRMPDGQAQEFDKIVKYIMVNVTRDPSIAKKGVSGGKISDAEILQIIQSYLHDRTPKQITELASRILESRQNSQQRQQPQMRNPYSSP